MSLSVGAVRSVDARTGVDRGAVAEPMSPREVARLTAAAAAAAPWLAGLGREGRATMLVALADAVEARRAEVVEVADLETALGHPRLNGELTRTCFQLRFLAEVILDGGYLGVSIDRAGDTPMGPRPDLRRTSVPLGPVAVFGAANFPLAFSVPGGDTASALAAGCPVLAKAHDSHVATSALVGEIFTDALAQIGAPEGVFRVVYGFDAGTALVTDQHITAVGFTGSLRGGRALFDLANQRPVPVPFYGELGSVNSLVVTEAAARERAAAIGAGLAASVSLGVGQFCTKPGLVLVPATAAGETVVAATVAGLAAVPAGVLLNDAGREAFIAGVQTADAESRVLYSGEPDGRSTASVLCEADVAAVTGARGQTLLEERFGPFALVVRYADRTELSAVLRALPPALTGTVQLGADDPEAFYVTAELAARSGRVVYNGFPTGVAVAWGMHHGGPYPAATVPAATSVGAAAIGRWLRPLSYQDAPDAVLPDELKDIPTCPLPRRIDGVLLPVSPSLTPARAAQDRSS